MELLIMSPHNVGDRVIRSRHSCDIGSACVGFGATIKSTPRTRSENKTVTLITLYQGYGKRSMLSDTSYLDNPNTFSVGQR